MILDSLTHLPVTFGGVGVDYHAEMTAQISTSVNARYSMNCVFTASGVLSLHSAANYTITQYRYRANGLIDVSPVSVYNVTQDHYILTMHAGMHVLGSAICSGTYRTQYYPVTHVTFHFVPTSLCSYSFTVAFYPVVGITIDIESVSDYGIIGPLKWRGLNRLLILSPPFHYAKHIFEVTGNVNLHIGSDTGYYLIPSAINSILNLHLHSMTLYAWAVTWAVEDHPDVTTMPTGWCLSDPNRRPFIIDNPRGTFQRTYFKQIPRVLEYFPAKGNGILSPTGLPIEVEQFSTTVVGFRCCTVAGLTNAQEANCPVWVMTSVYPSYYDKNSAAAGILPAYVAGITQCIDAKQL